MGRLLVAAAACWGLAQAQEIPVVTVNTLGDLAITQSYRAPAEVVSVNSSVIAAEVQAVVAAVHADSGARVAAGELVMTLDPTDLELAMREMEANLAALEARIVQAEQRLDRARNLSEGQYISADDLLARETDVAVLRAERSLWNVRLEIARRNVAKCRILAPFAGVVQRRFGQVGTFVRPGDPLLSLVQTDGFELLAEVPAHLAGTLRDDATATFTADGQSWPVSPLRISPLIEQARRIRRARYAFPGGAPPIGTSGELIWADQARSIPAHLLVRRADALGVFVLEGGSARFQPLASAEEGRPARTDLPAETVIVVGGRERLSDGDAVEVGVR